MNTGRRRIGWSSCPTSPHRANDHDHAGGTRDQPSVSARKPASRASFCSSARFVRGWPAGGRPSPIRLAVILPHGGSGGNRFFAVDLDAGHPGQAGPSPGWLGFARGAARFFCGSGNAIAGRSDRSRTALGTGESANGVLFGSGNSAGNRTRHARRTSLAMENATADRSGRSERRRESNRLANGAVSGPEVCGRTFRITRAYSPRVHPMVRAIPDWQPRRFALAAIVPRCRPARQAIFPTSHPIDSFARVAWTENTGTLISAN
jgi:hypothetical protein